ncbi:caspase family protein [Dactylococcopsis salina]|uniref:caspase family protein n=1 Tax=Dactylococcopsis salina TaxID=292566 RepID=UPI00059DC554|nr:caspase family protein [Dactylococcopsis salina]
MGIERRKFLQQTGLALLAWGVNGQIKLSFPPSLRRKILQQTQVLASGRGRKLALLVGINQYNGNNLKGCITDVEQQEELLRYRFGFQPQDILTLKNSAATRNQIITAFQEHLIKQAKPDDIIVVHFSG